MKKIILLAIITTALNGCSSPVNEPPKFSVFVDPPWNYFVCEKCGSLEGGCYVKAHTIKRYRSPKGLQCRHDWKRITKKEFYNKWKNKKDFNEITSLDQLSAPRKAGK